MSISKKRPLLLTRLHRRPPRRQTERRRGGSGGICPATSPPSEWPGGGYDGGSSSAWPPGDLHLSRSSPATPSTVSPAAPHSPAGWKKTTSKYLKSLQQTTASYLRLYEVKKVLEENTCILEPTCPPHVSLSHFFFILAESIQKKKIMLVKKKITALGYSRRAIQSHFFLPFLHILSLKSHKQRILLISERIHACLKWA